MSPRSNSELGFLCTSLENKQTGKTSGAKLDRHTENSYATERKAIDVYIFGKCVDYLDPKISITSSDVVTVLL